MFSSLLALLWFFLEYSMGFFPTLFPLFIAAGLYVLMTGRANPLLFMTVVGSIGLWVEVALAMAWSGERLRLEPHPEHASVTVALFVFAYGSSHWLHARDSVSLKDYGALLALWTLRFGLIAMLLMSFAEPWEALIEADWNHQISMWQLVIILQGAALWFGWETGKLRTLVPIVAFCTLSMIAVVSSDDSAHAVFFQVIYNIALVVSGIWLIVRGINSGISHYFFLGVAVILLTAFMRYADLIGDYVGGAILFMVLAVLLLGAARYWKAQRTKEAGA